MVAVTLSLVSMGEHAVRLVTSKENGCSAHVYQAILDFGVKQVG